MKLPYLPRKTCLVSILALDKEYVLDYFRAGRFLSLLRVSKYFEKFPFVSRQSCLRQKWHGKVKLQGKPRFAAFWCVFCTFNTQSWNFCCTDSPFIHCLCSLIRILIHWTQHYIGLLDWPKISGNLFLGLELPRHGGTSWDTNWIQNGHCTELNQTQMNTNEEQQSTCKG